MAVTASFSATGTLTVFGDNLNNTVTLSRNAAGSILVNGGAVAITGGTATVANTKLIQAFGQGGDDFIRIDEAFGAMPPVNLFGGAGNDWIAGGSANDMLFGQAGNDSLLGNRGNDFLFGGTENDYLLGGAGDDQMFGESGDDRMVWNFGDGTDLMEGGDGVDTAEVNGGSVGETFAITANGTRVRFDRTDATPFALDIGTTENLVVNANGGNDRISVTGNVAALINLTVDGGAGNDTILGGNGADTLLGGEGNDFIDGNQGNDTALLGAGDDTFQWDPGDGSDTVDGQAGSDALIFNGSNGAENFEIAANGDRARLTRNLGTITMDLKSIETISVAALGASDNIVVNDLSGTGVTRVNLNLGAFAGGGDAAADNVTVNGKNVADTIQVVGSGTTVGVTGLPAAVALTNVEAANDALVVNGFAGDDKITAAGLAAGMIKLTINGGAGNDAIFGSQGNDFLFGGTENDVLTGGAGDDQMSGEAGDDRMIWNPGDGTDLMEGGDGVDTAEVNGGSVGETFTITANGTRVRFDRIDAAPFALDIGTTEKLVVKANGGDDRISVTGNVAALIGLTIDGGAGNDVIFGGNGADTLLGGDGSDFIDGNQGNDTVLLGAGNDDFQWDPGDGSDTVDGQAGTDMLIFNGSAGNETFNVSANGDRVRLTRDIASITMDLKSVENIYLRTLGGSDNIVVNDLTGTGVTQVGVDLAGTIGGTAGDAAVDRVTVQGRSAADTIQVQGSGTSLSVTGLPATVNLTGVEGANDALVINGLGGDDKISAAALNAGIVNLTIDGGVGNDTITGSAGNDTLLGGDGNDVVSGGRGNDIADLGAGNDIFWWSPGDGNDTVEGGAGTDTMLFNGANIAEGVDIVANGNRVLFYRDVATVTMDLHGIEQIDYRALGGADRVMVGDLSGTDVTQVNIDLRGPTVTPDGAVDSVTVTGTQAYDGIVVSGTAGGVTVSGLPVTTKLTGMDATDQLTINGQGGHDKIDASGLAAGALQLTIVGGLGNDWMIGSQGSDLLNGGDGDDFANMGGGNDTFVWVPGDDNDTIEGGAGIDTLLFHGANVAETINIFANGGRASFTRDVATVTMDMNDVETINFVARGGADTINVGDMSGTDVTRVNIDLSGTPGTPGGDGAADKIVINGTGGNDVITVSLNSKGALVINGLPSQVVIENFDFNDTITINGLGGNDTITAAGINLGGARLVLAGGAGNDVLTGSLGNDTIIGGPGTNIMTGGGGVDEIYDELIIIHRGLAADASFHELMV